MRIGPSGGGISNKEGLYELHRLGLNAMEIPFTYGVWMKNAEAEKIGAIAKKLDISLSVHAPYYINLASSEPEKVHASMKRIIDSAARASFFGKTFVVFHAGFYQKYEPEQVYQVIKSHIKEMQHYIYDKGWSNVILAPETTGKPTQFGSLTELLRLHNEIGCGICVDFAHILARTGTINYDEVIDRIKHIKNLTTHFSGIEFTSKGERRHLLTPESEIRKLFKAIARHNFRRIRIINESPDPVGDALKMKKIADEILKIS